jgi:TetR/AcrR family transcriptional repressor of mexCD-oprJ operon
MAQPAVDHRRATAERNAAAIVDATERLLARQATLSMAAIAAEAGVSRVTLYAHFAKLSDVVEAAVERAVTASLGAIEAAAPGTGPADEALARVLAASWGHLAHQDALARAAAEHVSSERVRDKHHRLMAIWNELIRRGQRDRVFRDDLPADWLVAALYALLHAGADHARTRRSERAATLDMLTTTIRDLFAAR